MFKLIIEDDEGKTTVVPLIRDEITIGRKEGNTIRLTERNVSRRHARLSRQNGTVFIEDLGSYNGIKVNGNRIQGRTGVAEGDRIQIGDYLLALKMDRAQVASDARTDDLDELRKTQPMATPDLVEGVPDEPQPMRDTELMEMPPTAEGMGAPAAASRDEAAPHEESLDTAATIPVEQPEAATAHLHILSTSYAGQDFPLERAKTVIGRTDDNDVVVDHRSISRHHATIVRERNRYHIFDLQSANGVRVNGEEYGKVELQHGDIIDLGQVRMRFLVGEDASLLGDGAVINIPMPRPRNTFGLTVVIAVLALGAVAYLFRERILGGDKETTPGEATAPQNPELPALRQRSMQEIVQLISGERFDEAVQKSDALSKLFPSDAEVRELRGRVEAAKKSREAYERFQAARNTKDIDGAVKAFGEIATDSTYKAPAEASFAVIKTEYVSRHEQKALQLEKAGDCGKAKEEALLVQQVDVARPVATRIIQSCGVKVATPETPDPGAPRPQRPQPQPRPQPARQVTPRRQLPVEEIAEAELIAKEAQEAYVKGQYRSALGFCERALKINARNRLAINISAAASCQLNDPERALKALTAASPDDKKLIRFMCNNAGMQLPP